MANETTTTIRDQVNEFNVGFNEAVGPDLAAVFAGEQAHLTAGGTPDGAVAVGDTVPDAALLGIDEDTSSLSQLLGGRKGVLVFYRGAWCPYCNITLKHYQQTLDARRARRRAHRDQPADPGWLE